MKIKSKFKDYYDGVNPLYAEEPLFVRATQRFDLSYARGSHVLDCPEGPLGRLLSHLAAYPVECVTNANVAVFFCGKVYSGAHISGHSPDASGDSVYSERHFWKPSQDLLDSVLSIRRSCDRGYKTSDAEAHIARWFRDQGSKDTQLLDLQLTAVTPIVLRCNIHSVTYLVVNPILKAYDFAKIVPPEQAWQELSMFFGTVVMPERNTVQVSDKDRHAQHGFDKHSFRRTSKELKGH
jgi:hypothetical protein